MTRLTENFKNHVMDCLQDVIFATASDVCDAMIPKMQRRPHMDVVRKCLNILEDQGLVEIEAKGNPGGGWHRRYKMARTKPFRKAA